eukprot:1694126-Pyramimonas_sp.AAC.1
MHRRCGAIHRPHLLGPHLEGPERRRGGRASIEAQFPDVLRCENTDRGGQILSVWGGGSQAASRGC